MLTVISPAASTAAPTVEAARTALNLPAGNPTDQVLGRMIEEASQLVVDHCRRPFGRETVRETFRRICSEHLLLTRSPVVSIASVTVDGVGLLAPEYEIDEEQLFPLRDTRRWRWWGDLIAVQYTAGYTLPGDGEGYTLPRTVERAAILLVGAFLSARSRDPLVKAESVDGVGSTTWWVPGPTSGLPAPEAEQLLQPFRRAAWSVG